MTVAERTMKYLPIYTNINIALRTKIANEQNRSLLSNSTFEDVKQILMLMESGAASGI